VEPPWRKAEEVLGRGEDEALTYMTFLPEHWSRVYSTNPLDCLNREVKRRTDIVSIFPNPDSVLPLVGPVLIEIHDEWQAGRRYLSPESMHKLEEPEELEMALLTSLRLALIH